MKPSAYRKQVEKEVKEARAKATSRKAAPRGKDPASQMAAIEALGDQIFENDALFEQLLSQMGDPTENTSVRLTILGTIQAQGFASLHARARRPAWLAALRGLVDDPDPEVRFQALDLLSHEQDGHAQQVLLEGLREPSKAVVPPEKALLLLGNDIHAEVYPLARAIAANPPSPAAQREALRLLGADAESAPLFESIARDRGESPEIRRLAITALSTLAPANLRKYARTIVLSEDDDPEVVATSLAALAHDRAAAPADLVERVEELHRKGPPEVRVAAKRLLAKLSP